MFIYNIKLSGTKIFKFVFTIIILIVLVVFGITTYKIYDACNNSYDYTNSKDFIELNNHNYSNILKIVHEDVDTYIGQKIKFSGFIYRVYDLNQKQFVLGRNMIISSDLQTVVIGFLCEYKDAITIKDNTWIEIEGKITKGTYHGSDMPIIEVNSIKEINKPEDEYAYPPDENYIPTSVIL